MDAFMQKILPLFGGRLDQGQILGLGQLRQGLRHLPITQQAYVLATVFHETGQSMRPIYERGAREYFLKYEPETKLGKALGNRLSGDGYRYRGRGYVQLTGRANYARAGAALALPLEAQPDLALQEGVALSILIEGMVQGWFTGKSLGDYLGRDYLGARRIVNGTDRAQMIADYALLFEQALADHPRIPSFITLILNFFRGR